MIIKKRSNFKGYIVKVKKLYIAKVDVRLKKEETSIVSMRLTTNRKNASVLWYAYEAKLVRKLFKGRMIKLRFSEDEKRVIKESQKGYISIIDEKTQKNSVLNISKDNPEDG